jgi:hypothetical protein
MLAPPSSACRSAFATDSRPLLPVGSLSLGGRKPQPLRIARCYDAKRGRCTEVLELKLGNKFIVNGARVIGRKSSNFPTWISHPSRSIAKRVVHPRAAGLFAVLFYPTQPACVPAPSILDDPIKIRTLRRPSKGLAGTRSLCHQN